MRESTKIQTPLGPLLAVADQTHLHYLGFCDGRVEGTSSSPILKSIEKELDAYFAGKLKNFSTPLFFKGTDFQKTTWAALMKIPYGTTCSYAQLAESIGKPTASRAVANANGANPFVIIVPCHRVIYSDGSLGGYSAGLDRKKFLLQMEGCQT